MMKKVLPFANWVGAVSAIALATTSINSPAAIAQNLSCPSLDEALVPVEHPVRTRLNQYFRAEGHSGEVNNVVRVGNYGAAYLWNRDSNGRATSATPVAIEFEGDRVSRAVLERSNVATVVESWGASADTAQCVLQLLAESGI